MMDLDTLYNVKNSVDVPLAIDFHLHLLVDKGEQKSKKKEKKERKKRHCGWLLPSPMLLFIDASL